MKKLSESLLLLFLLLALFPLKSSCATPTGELIKHSPDEQPLTLEADDITFDEQKDIAEANGHAVARYLALTLRADRITLQPNANVMKAYAVNGKKVSVKQSSGETIVGDYLEYNINESSGFIDNPQADGPVPRGRFYIHGEQMQSETAENAHAKKWMHKKYLKSSEPDTAIVKWNNSDYTTCPQEKPHYHLRSKKITMVPGKYIILHKPKFYAGEKYIFTSPFNYLVNEKRKRFAVTIMPNYDGDKGAGLEAKAVYNWGSGLLTLGAAEWTEDIFEYTLRLDQKVTDWMSVYVGDRHHYDDDLEDTKSRPFWGANFSRYGWDMEIGWAQREKRSVVRKPGQEAYDTTLWRDPEFEITTPWASLKLGDFEQYARLKGDWGRFQETGTNRKSYDGSFIERYGWGFDYYTDHTFRLGLWTISPFLKANYWNYGYKNDSSDRHIITTATVGYRASCGIFEMGTAFEQRRTSGKSAFGNGWDKKNDVDTLYQRFGFQIAPNWHFAVQAIFDLTEDEEEWASIGYVLTYDNKDCTKWILTVNDDLTDKNSEDWVTLSFAITAFPDTNYKIGTDTLENPFGRPVPRKKKDYVPTVMEAEGTLAEESRISRMPKFDI